MVLGSKTCWEPRWLCVWRCIFICISVYLDMSTSDTIVIYEIHLQTPTTALSRRNQICREVLVNSISIPWHGNSAPSFANLATAWYVVKNGQMIAPVDSDWPSIHTTLAKDDLSFHLPLHPQTGLVPFKKLRTVDSALSWGYPTACVLGMYTYESRRWKGPSSGGPGWIQGMHFVIGRSLFKHPQLAAFVWVTNGL